MWGVLVLHPKSLHLPPEYLLLAPVRSRILNPSEFSFLHEELSGLLLIPSVNSFVFFFTVGSSSSLSSGGSFSGRHLAVGAAGEALEGPSSLRYTFADPITANLEGAVTFEAPELPEETLMEVSISRAKDRGIKVKQIQTTPCFASKGGANKTASSKRARPVKYSENPGHI